MKKLAFLSACALLLAALVGGCSEDGLNGPTPTGSIQVATSTTGDDLDPDGYTCRVDGGAHSRAIGTNDTEVISNLATGSHTVELAETSIADNCTVSGDNPGTVTVQANQTAEVTFNLTCAPLTGVLEVTTVTEGDTLDPDGYTVRIDDTTSEAIAINGIVMFLDLEPGSHSVELDGVAKNCSVGGDNPQTVTVSAGATMPVSFEISCAPALFDHIAFRSIRDGNYEIYVMDPDGSNQINLTNNLRPDVDPAWSPDGTRIAFATHRDGNYEIYIMGADGSNPTRVTDNPADEFQPAWSPDGTKIAFNSYRDGNVNIYVIDADGSNETRLTDDPATDRSAAWSPDGTKVAFVSTRDGDYDIYVMDPDGSNQISLTDNTTQELNPDWSPDGSQIVFDSYRDLNYEVYVMAADGSNQTNLTNDAGANNWEPAWSPDGARIAFNLYSDVLGNLDIYVMDADGSNPTALTDDPAYDDQPDWSPMR
jgi:Tol biopolymer transport system component